MQEGNSIILYLTSAYRAHFCQRMLAQLVSHSGSTPQVLSSTPRGSEFQAEGKKNPLAGPVCQSTGCETALVGLRTLTWPRHSSQGLRLPLSGRGQGSGIFSVGEAEASS
jgi:hypothetical protein